MSSNLHKTIEDTVTSRPGLYPLLYVVTGSRGYEMNTEGSDWDVVGIHLSDDILEHPKHRRLAEVQEWKDISYKDSVISVVSYEAWKYLDMLKNGAFAAYEIQDMKPQAFYQPLETEFQYHLIADRRKYAPTAFIYSALGNAKSDMWTRCGDKDHGLFYLKKVIMGYFRLSQAASVLASGEITHNISVFHKCDKIIDIGRGLDLLFRYMEIKTVEERRKALIERDLENFLRDEVSKLRDWIESTAMNHRAQPVPEDRFQKLLTALKKDRRTIIKEGSRYLTLP